MVQIVDNFLPANLFARFQHLMMGAEFPWYFVLGVADHKDDDYYFIHNIYGCKEHDNGDGQKYRDVESQYFKDFEISDYKFNRSKRLKFTPSCCFERS